MSGSAFRIDTQAALEEGAARLGAIDPEGVAAMLAIGGSPTVRANRDGFAGLVATIVAQQVSIASAAAIHTRLAAALDPLTPEAVQSAGTALLRRCGLSAGKTLTLQAVALAVADGSLPLDPLASMPADAAHARLVTVRGIGPWTADVFLLFCLGQPDAFPAGDLALQEAARLVFGQTSRPKAAELLAFAERWRPYRGVAAYLLWACYRAVRGIRTGPVPVAS